MSVIYIFEKIRKSVYCQSLPVADPKILKGGAEHNLSVPS